MKNNERSLTKRDWLILQFVVRYRASTIRLIWTKFFANTSPDNATRVIRRLERRNLLQKHQCGGGIAYVMPTRQGLSVAGVPTRTPRQFTEQSLPVALAIASYCVSQGLSRVTNAEFCKLYPELTRPGLRSSNYVLDNASPVPVLELLTVDRGGTARRIRGRVRRLIAQRIGLPAFQALMAAGRFRIQILIGTRQQQHRIETYLSRGCFEPVQTSTALVQELGDILLLGDP